MNGLIEWFARNPVAANLLMALLVCGGLLTIPMLGQEMVPDVDLDLVTVTVPYPGASPEEVEQSICLRIEDALTGLPGIKSVRSTASESSGNATVQLLAGEDVSRRLADIRARIDAIDNFPVDAERPIVRQAEIGKQVLSIAIAGDTDEWTLKAMGERVRDGLAAQPEITEVTLSSVRPYEVSIEVSESALERFGMTFDHVVQAVRRSSIDLPGGVVRAQGGEILLRAKGQAFDREGFESIPLVSRPDGTRLTVGDVAEVSDAFAESDQRATFDGEPSVLVTVLRVGDQKLLSVADAAIRYVDEIQPTLPEGLEVTVWQNGAIYLEERLGSMLGNARGGFFLVVLVLALFLRLRLALWVALGIPIAFLGAVAVMPTLGMSINWISLLAFIVVLGIVVDDAIVVGESTYTEHQRTGEALEGAIRGTKSVAIPVFFGVATTVAAFAPMLFIPGAMGRFTRVLPLIVIACLVFSLVEALLVLPGHLGHSRNSFESRPVRPVSVQWRKLQNKIASGLDHLIHQRYKGWLEQAIEWRYLTLAGAVAILMVTMGILAGGWLRFTFQEPVEGDVIVADLTMAPGTPVEATTAALRRLEVAAYAVQQAADAERDLEHGSIFRHVLTSVGEQPFRKAQSQMPGGPMGRVLGGGGNLGEVQVEMIDSAFRDIGTDEMQRRWREAVGAIPGVTELAFHNTMISAGKPVELEMHGGDLVELESAATALKEALARYPGVFDVADSFRIGKRELTYRVLPQAEMLGLSVSDLGRQVRQAFQGEEVQRIQRGRDDVAVIVRYPEAERRSLNEVSSMRIRTAEGLAVPFEEVASVEIGKGFASIQRVDRQRVVTVTADVDVALGNANEVVADLQRAVLPQILEDHPGVGFSFAGEQAEQRDFMDAMVRGQALALLVIYALLAIPLRSYSQPIIIMSAIPFGLVGAAVGHLLLGYDFSMYSIIGLVALSGVVVNSSLVLVDRVNQLREAGERLADAVREAACGRFRAIMLTSLTTFAGLTPMMLENSMSARFMIPMALSLAFGVVFSSAVTLFFVPCAYIAMEDATLLFRGKSRRRAAERIASARADQDASDAAAAKPGSWDEEELRVR